VQKKSLEITEHNPSFSGQDTIVSVVDNGFLVKIQPNHAFVTTTFSEVVNLLGRHLGLLKVGQAFSLTRTDDEEIV
jgi:hypothetical protein